jgi:hypothetical protein
MELMEEFGRHGYDVGAGMLYSKAVEQCPTRGNLAESSRRLSRSPTPESGSPVEAGTET